MSDPNHGEPKALGCAELGSLVVEQMAEAVILVDAEGFIRLWNRGAEAIFGFTAAEAIGAKLDLIVPEPYRLPHAIAFRNAFKSGRLRSEGSVVTTRSNHKYGTGLYVDFSLRMLRDAAGEVIGVFAVGRDATERHLGEVAARRAVQ